MKRLFRTPSRCIALVLVAALGMGGCSARAQHPPEQLSAGSMMPALRYQLSNGDTLSSDDLRGHAYMLWLMATWCSSCQGGTNVIAQHISQLRTRNVRVLQFEVANDLGYPGPPVSAFKQAAGPAGKSPNWFWGELSEEQMQILDPKGYPDVYYLVDSKGTIVHIDGAPAATWNAIDKFASTSAN